MKKIKKDSRENIFFSVLILLLFFLVTGFLIYSNVKISQKRTELLTKIENLKKEIQVLEKKNEELRTGIEKTESEDYQEKILSEQGYIRKGAQQVVVLPPKEGEKEKTSEQKNLWQRLLEKIGL